MSDYKSSCILGYAKQMTKEAKVRILRKWRSILYYIFQLCGFFYTGHIVYGNLKSYYSYKSNKIQRELEDSIHKVRTLSTNFELCVNCKPNVVRLPNVMICADSMHSKRKVSSKYPQLNKTMLQELYGLNVKGLKQSMWDVRQSLPDMFQSLKRDFDKQYKELNTINLTQFYKDTTPVYFMAQCEMETIDCRENWIMKSTSYGNCLWLNTTEVYKTKVKSKKDKNKQRIKRIKNVYS